MRLFVNKKDQKALNLNVYRNLHFFQNNLMKTQFHELMEPLLKGIPKMDQVKLHYVVNSRTKTRLDTMNVGSVVDKFFSDSLVNHGIIPDDDYKHVVFNSFEYGRIQPEEHVLVTITEIKPRSDIPMRILLDEDDIQTALETYVESLGIEGSTGVEISVVDENTINAEVIIGDKPKVKAKPKPRVSRKPAAKPAPKEPTPDVADTDKNSPDSNGTGSTESPNTESEPKQEDPKSDDTSINKAEGSKAKNIFGESQEASSKVEKKAEAETPKPVKKSSIFDT